MKKLLTEPLLHFILLGALIFWAYGLVGPDQPDAGEIRVTRGQQEHLVTAFSRTWQRRPSQDEFTNLVDDWIREEIAYREGMRMGLDTDDTIIRRRLRQKLELLAEDVVSMVQPEEADLQAWLDNNADDYRAEPVWTLEQVYFSLDRRGDAAVTDAEEALVLLAAGDALVDPSQVGDPLPLPTRHEQARASALAAQFGQVFVEDIEGLAPGAWTGPVKSGYGLHLVRIEQVQPARARTLEEARVEVQRDWLNAERKKTLDELYERLREQYNVVVESPAEAGDATG